MASDDFFLNDEEQRVIRLALTAFLYPDSSAPEDIEIAESLLKEFQPPPPKDYLTFLDEHPKWIGPGHAPDGTEYE